MPTKKWWAALGGVLVALATEFFITPLDGGETLEWSNGEWKILSAGVLALFLAYMTRNDSTPSGDGVTHK